MHRAAHRFPPPLLLTLVLAALAPSAPAAAQNYTASPAGLAAFNDSVQELYDGLRPDLEAALRQKARTELEGLEHTSGKWEVEVERLRALRLKIAAAPGLQAASTQRLEVAVPARGTWELELEVDIMIRKTRGWWRPSIRLREVRISVSELRAVATVELDDSDPLRPVVRRVHPPQLDARVRLRSGRFFTDLLLRILSPFANKMARKAVADALDALTPQLAALQGLPGVVPGDGSALLTDSGTATPWDEVVGNVERKMRADHLPYGTLLHARSNTPTRGTWLDDYRAGGAGNVGAVTPTGDGGDSAIWTGHYLAAEALRYSVTQDPAALDNVRHAVRGISALLEVHGETGLLARVAVPSSSAMGAALLANTRVRPFVHSMRGEVWVGSNGRHGISRDQYMGVFMGLALAYELVPDSAVRAECRLRVEQMLDYLVAERWFVDEDRPEFDPLTAQGQNGFPTFWAPSIDQKLNSLLIGQRLVGPKYDAQITALNALAETDWLGTWMSCFTVDSYYKFNLAHGTYYNYFRLETNPVRRGHLERGFLIMRRYVGHHKNPHFELIHASIDPSMRPKLFPAAKEGLRRFLQRPHRFAAPAVVDLSGVTFVTVNVPSFAIPGQPAPPSTVTRPSEPLDPELRPPGGDFLWQRGPFNPAQAGSGDPYKEQAGIALTLPYWMGRYHGAW